jgi:pimeloyl-ACP methyl ester carboxylesterase
MWIGTDEGRVVIVREAKDGQPALLLDDPGRLRFRQPVAPDRLAGLSLRQIVEIAPGELDEWCGWYGQAERRVLLTQIPEPSLGEPMVLVGDASDVLRAYPVEPGRFVRADGVPMSLLDGERGRPALRFGEGESARVLSRDAGLSERAVEFRVGPDTLAATLVTPPGAGPHPAAVVVHGAAGGQRDFYRLLVEPVLDAGIALLLYDKRGHGRSTGSPEVTIFDQAQAAAGALDRLVDEPDIDATRLGLVGFSNGMWSVPMIASDRPDLAFVAGVAGPGVSIAEAEVHRRSKTLRDEGMSAATAATAGEAWRCVFAAAGAGAADEALRARLSAAFDALRGAPELRGYQVPDYARENPLLSPVPPLVSVDELVGEFAGRPDPELGYDPVADYARSRCPLFLQWGADDTNVPVEVSAQRIRAALPNPSTATLRVYPGVEHMLNVTVTDVVGISPEEAMYGFHGFHFSPSAREDLRDWLRVAVASVP